MSRAACVKYNSRIKRALEMKNGTDLLWVIMGRTSAWDGDPEVPEVPSPSDNDIVEPFLAIKPDIVSMAKEVTAEAYALLDGNDRAVVSIEGVAKYLQLVDDADAYTESARYLYIRALYDPVIAGHPAFTEFRSYYLTSGLEPASGYENSTWLVPDNIAESGYGLVEYENSGTVVSGGYSISMPIVLEFR